MTTKSSMFRVIMPKMTKLRRFYLLLIFGTCVIISVTGTETFFGKEQEVCDGEKCDSTSESPESVSTKPVAPPPDHSTDISDPPKPAEDYVNIIITFVNAEHNHKFQKKFELTVGSLLRHSSVPLAMYIIGEAASQRLAAEIIDKVAGTAVYKLMKLDIDHLAKDLSEVVRLMQEHFSYKPGAYYNHALFFLSIAIHRVLPSSVDKIIMLDADLKFLTDIKQLYDRFDMFTEENVIGIGHDLQPVYRHALWKYRQQNKNTMVGEPVPEGEPGFNSGVLLLHVDHMRHSQLYNSLLTSDSVKTLTEEFHFKGHLGDQDFFSLINWKYGQLFHKLPCSWNRQLCVWWREHGYQDIFHLYHDCPGPIHIYHGNCDTPIPED